MGIRRLGISGRCLGSRWLSFKWWIFLKLVNEAVRNEMIITSIAFIIHPYMLRQDVQPRRWNQYIKYIIKNDKPGGWNWPKYVASITFMPSTPSSGSFSTIWRPRLERMLKCGILSCPNKKYYVTLSTLTHGIHFFFLGFWRTQTSKFLTGWPFNYSQHAKGDRNIPVFSMSIFYSVHSVFPLDVKL